MHEFVDIKCAFPWRWFWILSNQELDRRDILIHNKEVHCIHKRPKVYRESIFAYIFISIFQKDCQFWELCFRVEYPMGRGKKVQEKFSKSTFSQCPENLSECFLWTGRSLILQVYSFLLCEKMWYKAKCSLRKQEFGLSGFPLDSRKMCSDCDKHCCTQFMLLFFNSL